MSGAEGLPDAAFIEIVERTDDPDPKVIVPNEVRINGIPLLVPPFADGPIVVHEIAIGARDVVRVTLTLFARRVVIGPEPREAAAADVGAGERRAL